MSNSSRQDDRKNWLEWSMVIAGALIIVLLAGYLGWSAIQDNSSPPDLGAVILERTDSPYGVRYRVEVENGGGSAEDVTVEICDDGNRCASHTFRHVPLESKREALIILKDPRNPVVARIVSYTEM